MEPQCTEEQFLKGVAEHKIEIVRDDGLYRHVRFRKNGSYCMGFDLVTWPGFLCFCGDMGEFVFSRTADMFSFFRGSGHRNDDHKTIAVNFGYWAEKCQAADNTDGLKKYDPDKFREVVNDIVNDDENVTDELRQEIKDEVLWFADDGPYAAYGAAINFEWNGKLYFQDFWEHSLNVYTYRFIWCCYAMAWGIEQYDKAKIDETAG
jgi:hypothetical protein